MQNAKKRTRQILKRTIRNRQAKSKLKTTTRRFNEALNIKDVESAGSRYKALIKEIDQATAKGILHKNNAARKKSSFTRQYNVLVKENQSAL